MVNNALLHFLCMSAVFHQGLNSVIQTQRTVMAAVGDQACLNCRLIQTVKVDQVTWEKILPDRERHVATVNLRFGQTVDPHYRGKVEFGEAGLQNSSIVIREVTEQDEGCYRCLFYIYPKGALIATTCLQIHAPAALIQTQRTVMAAVGGQACLNCSLVKFKEVHQVTWQKVLPDGERNVGTYSKYSIKRVNTGFQGKVEFRDAGLQSSSIVIRKVTEQDEGCYRCLFNTYPDGALICSTCLRLYELHEPVLHVRESNSSEEVIVSCSATGRPAPTLSLSVLHHKLNFSTHSYKNTNGTVTVSATGVLRRNYDNSTRVECEAQLPAVPLRKEYVMIPAAQLSPAILKVDSGSSDADITLVIAPVVTGVFLLVLLCVLLLLVLKRKQLNSFKPCCKNKKDPEVIKTPLATNEKGTPLMKQQNEQESTRQRTGSSVKKLTGQRPSPQTPPCRRQLY